MRWAGQEISNEADDPEALPGLDRLHHLVRSVRTPEFAGITFHEVLAKSALNHVSKAAGLPFNWTVNPYRGCSHGCVYCFARNTTPTSIWTPARTSTARSSSRSTSVMSWP